jgi:hypothetical protein
MIPLNELRVGNRIEWSPFASMGKGYDTVILQHMGYHHLMDPIPLTEEWLIKFGFEKDAENTSWYNRGIISVSKNGNIAFHLEGKWLNSKVRVDSVHQLQNLYFALTGEELTIKE